jgi:hypothetical protein
MVSVAKFERIMRKSVTGSKLRSKTPVFWRC